MLMLAYKWKKLMQIPLKYFILEIEGVCLGWFCMIKFCKNNKYINIYI